jgi:hypothetical protein
MGTWYDAHDTGNIRPLDNARDLKSYAIQSQYSASARILAIAAGVQSRLDAREDIDLFYLEIVNIYTARGEGLDNWGRILAIGRTIAGPYLGESFGFDKSGLHPFNQLPFVPDSTSADTAALLTLEDEQFRLLLLYKAMSNISRSEIDALNSLLKALIDTGVGGFAGASYVLEVAPMVIRWVFEDWLTPIQLAVFKAAGTLNRGAGVGWELYAINPREVFGFDGSGMHPFNQAPFAPDKALIVNRS